MTRFRVRPVEVEAVQWTGKNFEEVKAFAGNSLSYLIYGGTESSESPQVDMHLITFNGTLTIYPYDWIVREINGHFSICKDSVFGDIYEEIKEEEDSEKNSGEIESPSDPV